MADSPTPDVSGQADPDPRRTLRLSDRDRDQVIDVLRGHFVDGRLDLVEFEERLEIVAAAKVEADLDPAMDGLPPLGPLRPTVGSVDIEPTSHDRRGHQPRPCPAPLHHAAHGGRAVSHRHHRSGPPRVLLLVGLVWVLVAVGAAWPLWILGFLMLKALVFGRPMGRRHWHST